MKYPVIQTKNYIVYVEEVQEVWFIHMDVFKWSKTIKQQFLSDWNAWTDEVTKDRTLFAMPFIDDTKMEKWTDMTGFKLIKHHQCTDGIIRKLYKFSYTVANSCHAAGSK